MNSALSRFRCQADALFILSLQEDVGGSCLAHGVHALQGLQAPKMKRKQVAIKPNQHQNNKETNSCLIIIELRKAHNRQLNWKKASQTEAKVETCRNGSGLEAEGPQIHAPTPTPKCLSDMSALPAS